MHHNWKIIYYYNLWFRQQKNSSLLSSRIMNVLLGLFPNIFGSNFSRKVYLHRMRIRMKLHQHCNTYIARFFFQKVISDVLAGYVCSLQCTIYIDNYYITIDLIWFKMFKKCRVKFFAVLNVKRNIPGWKQMTLVISVLPSNLQ